MARKWNDWGLAMISRGFCIGAILAQLAMVIFAIEAHAEKRVALVIGNAAYQNTPALSNPVNDGEDLATALRKIGFTVVLERNLNKRGMEAAIARFARLAQSADAAMFFYAGHGMQWRGTNYLVPTDAKLEDEFNLNFELTRLDDVLFGLERASGIKILVVDACRNNPLVDKLNRISTTRDLVATRGLAKIEPSRGMVIAYSTQINQVAVDGTDRNSPFTSSLVKEIEEPGVEIGTLFRRVAAEVNRRTEGRQLPELSLSLVGEFYLNNRDTDIVAWSKLRNSEDPVPLKKFISDYPKSMLVTDARQRLASIERQNQAAHKKVEELKPASPAPAIPVPAPDEVLWSVIKDSKSTLLFEEFLQRYPTSSKAMEARARLDEFKKLAAVVPPVQPPQLPPAAPTQPAVGVFPDLGVSALSSARERSLKAKDTFKECDRCPEMVVVPAGEFTMGSPSTETGRESGESPEHRVTIARPFAIGRFAVTFEEWDACVAGGGCDGYKPWDNGWGRARHPVINVSWNDAKNYIAWLSRITGKSYRLASEAEREYVTRAGTNTPFWWGKSISSRQANYNGTNVYDKGVKGEYRQKTVPVNSFEPNPWSLYQMHGNVWEWMEDCLNDTYKDAPSNGSAWTAGDCRRRVLRGGSWVSSPAHLRSASRYGVNADGRVSNVGFRVVRVLSP
ncbi:MAG: SUMF1/EgtB/PvdO family nonheme iron enzyme [Pseudorhodoplanes sp.]|nr:SUMF1/EgtB/PvdO family nonheme iron enzyme [Pseudorhodoplanes sp.]